MIVDLLREESGLDLGTAPEMLDVPATLAELQPAEFRADLVLRSAGAEDGCGPRAWVVEVQLHIDEDKRFTWPLYAAGIRQRLRCPVTLVVLTLDESVARWAATPIALDERGSMTCPVVLGPGRIPAVTDVAAARAQPELAVVSVLAHAHGPRALDVGRALLEACRDLDDVRGRLYTDVVFAFLNDAARRALEVEMQLDNYIYQSEFARRFVAQGREEGREVGRVEALASAVLEVLEARGLEIDQAARVRVVSCTDADQLHAWLKAAVTAASTAALFA